MEYTNKYEQQGDVLFYPIGKMNPELMLKPMPDAIPTEAKVVENGVIVSGTNDHTVRGGAVYKQGDEMFVKAAAGTVVVHPEHKEIVLPEGDYVARIVMEYDHFAEEARQVRD